MNIRRIIIIIVAAIVGIIGVSLVSYFLSFHKVSVTIGGDFKVGIYDTNNKLKVSLAKTGDTYLQNGDYQFIPSGEKINTSSIAFTVKDKDISKTIDPDYSIEYLAQLLADQKPSIQSVLTSAYAPIISGFKVGDGQLVQKGEWYITTLTKIVATSTQSNDVYRTILKYSDKTWKIVIPPTLTIGYIGNKDVPGGVIDKANSLIGDSGNAYKAFIVKPDNSQNFYNDY